MPDSNQVRFSIQRYKPKKTLRGRTGRQTLTSMQIGHPKRLFHSGAKASTEILTIIL